MGAVYFYHLTARPVDEALRPLLERSLANDWRVAVRGRDPARLDWLDQKLWLGPEDRFLPHGRAGGRHDAAQPVLLTTEVAAANRPQCVICIDGADLGVGEPEGLERACVLFDGTAEAELTAARGLWKRLIEAGAAAQYWAEEDGRWEKKAERPAAS
jgi:DNA polymerase-3 subunit chi